MVKSPPANAGDVGDTGSIPGSGRSLREGYGNPLQYSCLEDPMDRGAWQATVHGINPQGVGHHTHTQSHSYWFHPHGYITFPNCVSKSYHIGDETSTYGFSVQFSSVAQSCLTLRSPGLQHARPPCPSPTHGVYSNSCP